jgi:cytochrome c oxidase subunit II
LLGPESAHSPNAEDMTTLYWVMFAIGVILLVAINGALIGLAVRYRRSRGREPRRLQSRGRIQLLAGGGFAALGAVIFVLGVTVTDSTRDVELASAAPLEIKASGQQWIWRYEYPDGTFSYYQLVVPADTPVVLNLVSTDVVHRWWVPGLSAKADAVPGSTNSTWFKVDSDELGDNGEADFEGASYAFSGPSYATMRTQVRVLPTAEYQAWLKTQADEIAAAQAFVQRKIAEGGPLQLSEGSEKP